MPLRPAILLLLVLLWQAPVPAAGQDPAANVPPAPPPDELIQTRRVFEIQSLTRATVLAKQFADALANVVKEAGAEGDYEQAFAAQRRREQLVALYSQSLDDGALSDAIVLKPGDARTNGAITYDRVAGMLVGWKTVGSIATWDVPRITPGAYDVTITYATADFGDASRVNPFAPAPDLSTGGGFEFYEDSSLPGAEQNRRTGEVSSTGGWTEWETLTLPVVRITRTPMRFSLKITKTRGSGGVMNLKSIRLSPSANGSGAAPSQPSTPDAPPPSLEEELNRLQQAHLDNLRKAITPIVNTYTDSMKALAAKYVISDAQAAEDYNAEALRAAQIIEDPQEMLSGPRGPRQGANPDGFQELRNATFVNSERNSGDRFRIRQGSEEFFVRLLWVTCPPANGKDMAALRPHTDYFGIGLDEVRSLGQQARDFTASYLSGRPLTVLTRGTKDERGDLLVSLRPEGLGDFAGVLVDHGLAMINVPSARKGPPRQHEESMLHGLKERENIAKTQKIPRGAWALGKPAGE